MVAMQWGCLLHNNNNPFELLMLPKILSCQAAVTNIWVFSCCLGCETPQFVKGMLSIHRLGRQDSEEEEKMCYREEDRKIEKEGRKTASNPLKYFLNPLSSAQPDKQYILQPPPERGLCNQSFLSVRQLVVHTGSQLGWKEREKDRKRDRERGREMPGLSQWQWRKRGQSFSDDFLLHWQAAAL